MTAGNCMETAGHLMASAGRCIVTAGHCIATTRSLHENDMAELKMCNLISHLAFSVIFKSPSGVEKYMNSARIRGFSNNNFNIDLSE